MHACPRAVAGLQAAGAARVRPWPARAGGVGVRKAGLPAHALHRAAVRLNVDDISRGHLLLLQAAPTQHVLFPAFPGSMSRLSTRQALPTQRGVAEAQRR